MGCLWPTLTFLFGFVLVALTTWNVADATLRTAAGLLGGLLAALCAGIALWIVGARRYPAMAAATAPPPRRPLPAEVVEATAGGRPPPRRSVSMNELAALSDEIAALARGGIPFEKGLAAMGRETPGRLGILATTISHRLSRGESLVSVLEADDSPFPRPYRAVVLAGLRAGRLPVALEGITATVRRLAEWRRTILVSLIYPVVVLLLATALLMATSHWLAPVVAHAYEYFEFPRPVWYAVLLWIARYAPPLLPWCWGAAVVLFLGWLVRSGSSSALAQGRAWGLPSMGRIRRLGRLATFTDLLALMLENEVPLDEALSLASAASGDRALAAAGAQLSESVRHGLPLQPPAGFPPFVCWLIGGGVSEQGAAKALRRRSESYQRQARHAGNWWSVVLPLFLSVGVGGTVAFYYVLLVMAPFYHMLLLLSQPY